MPFTIWIEGIEYTLQGDKAMKDGKHIYTIDIENQTVTYGKDFEPIEYIPEKIETMPFYEYV